MNIEVISKPFELTIAGFGAVATDRDYSSLVFSLSGKMWDVVKSNGISNKGKNVWVYETAHKVFSGVELDNPEDARLYGLELKVLHLEKYAYFKHNGPYRLIGQAGKSMIEEVRSRGFKIHGPSIEIYGHWTGNEATSETELFMYVYP